MTVKVTTNATGPNRWQGLSTDQKPGTDQANVGDTFYETDTTFLWSLLSNQNIGVIWTSGFETYSPNILATGTNDEPPSGSLGEYQSASLSSAQKIQLSNGVTANVLSLSLHGGDWDIEGQVSYNDNSGSTSIVDMLQGITTTSASAPAQGQFTRLGVNGTTARDLTYETPMTRIKIPFGGGTVFLVAQANFSVNTLFAYGFLRARLAR